MDSAEPVVAPTGERRLAALQTPEMLHVLYNVAHCKTYFQGS